MSDYDGLSKDDMTVWAGIPDIRLPKPTMILGVGIGGSGKSTLLRPLARLLVNGVYVDKDLINYSFLWKPKGEPSDISRYYLPNTGDPIPRISQYYGDNICLQTYHCMLMIAKQMLGLGKHPILDGNYIKEIRRGYIDEVLKPQLRETKHRLKILLMHASPETIRQRIVARGSEHDANKLTDEAWRKLMQEQPPIPPEIERYPHYKVDTSFPLTQKDSDSLIEFLRS